jgi:hypothetical protein
MVVQRYKGVDLSETALALAAENLKSLSCPVELVCRDILAALAADTGLYDVVYTTICPRAEGGVLPRRRAEIGGGRVTVADRHRAGRRRKPASLLEAVL